MQQKNDKTIDQDGEDVLDPRRALAESTLSMDMARAEIDVAVATAHRFPRIIDTVIKEIETMACYNEEAAANCIYSLPRGGKPIIGPSIGFANIVASAWGHCREVSRPSYVDRKEKKVYAEGAFQDLQKNRTVVITESRRIVDKHGRIYSDDMIIVTEKAAGAIARRNAILNVVPRAVWHPIYEKALLIVRGNERTFAERKDAALRAFAQFGVKPEQVFAILNLKGEPDLTLEHLPTLRGMYQQLRDGTETVESMFDPRRQVGHGFEQVENPLGDAPDTASGGGGEPGVDESDPTAGMGEAPQSQAQVIPEQAAAQAARASQDAPAAAVATKGQPVLETAPAATVGPAQAIPMETVKAVQGTQAPAPAAAPATAPTANGHVSSPEFKSPEEYLTYWEGFIASCTSASKIAAQWTSDRTLRTKCMVIGPQFDAAKTMRDQAEEQLRKRGSI